MRYGLVTLSRAALETPFALDSLMLLLYREPPSALPASALSILAELKFAAQCSTIQENGLYLVYSTRETLHEADSRVASLIRWLVSFNALSHYRLPDPECSRLRRALLLLMAVGARLCYCARQPFLLIGVGINFVSWSQRSGTLESGDRQVQKTRSLVLYPL